MFGTLRLMILDKTAVCVVTSFFSYHNMNHQIDLC